MIVGAFDAGVLPPDDEPPSVDRYHTLPPEPEPHAPMNNDMNRMAPIVARRARPVITSIPPHVTQEHANPLAIFAARHSERHCPRSMHLRNGGHPAKTSSLGGVVPSPSGQALIDKWG